MQITVAVFVRSILQIKAKRNKWKAPTRSVGRRPFKPQTEFLRWRGLRGAEVNLAIARHLA